MKSLPPLPSSRRRFLGHSALVLGLPTLVPASVLGAAGQTPPSGRITVGSIGVGPQGLGVMQGFLQAPGTRVVAVCDVKQDQLRKARDLVNQHYGAQDCAGYEAFEELLARRDIDVVTVATPDHWHVLVALAAVRAGKDVYVEKPLGLSVAEDQALRTEIRQRGRMFQFGTQQRSGANFRRACELVRNGRLGRLQHLNVWSVGSVPGGSTAPEPVPAGLNYDRWLGPAPWKPHRRDLCSADGQKKTWWYISDYALGFIAGWGIHPMDIAYWGYPEMLQGPLEVAGQGTFPLQGACDTATDWSIDFKFASGVTMNFRGVPISQNGGEPLRTARLWAERYGATTHHGTAFEGTEGWVLVDRTGLRARPESLLETSDKDLKARLPQSRHHALDLLDSVRTRKPAVANIEEAVRSDILCHLSDLALRLKRRLTWDPQAEQFVGDEAANQRLAARAMRPPWHL